MIDQARIVLNRPLSDGDRPRLFAISAVLIVAGALILAVIGRTPTRPTRPAQHPASSASTPSAATSPALAPVSAEATGPPSEEARPNPPLELSARERRVVKRTARTFLAGYLAYSYGHGSAGRIRAASARLRAELAAEPPRVPPRERRRHPGVVLVQLDGGGRTWAGAMALVDDHARRYSVSLTLARVGGGWQVTRAGD